MEVQNIDEAYEKGYEAGSTSTKSEGWQSELYKRQQQEQFNIFRLNSLDWIEVLAREFAGQMPETIIDEEGEAYFTGKWIKDPNKMPLVNEAGVALIKTVYLNYANKGTYLAKLDRPIINNVCFNIWCDLACEMGFYHKKYGVANHMRDMVIHNVVNKIYIELTRPLNGTEANLISKGYTHIEHEQFTTPKQSIFNRMLGKK